MKYCKTLCLALAALMVLMLSGCSLGQDLLLDGNDVLAGEEPVKVSQPDTDDPLQEVVPDPDPPVQAVEEAEPVETPLITAVPAPTAEPTPKPTAEPTPKPTAEPTPEPTATPAPAARAGTYYGEDGSVLTVKESGDCTYKTTVAMVVAGEEVTETVTFRGTVSAEGDIRFTKVTYHGMDITAFAAQAGYEDTSFWEDAAAAIYKK